MKKLVVLTGAGISAESGIPTFRDADGLWEGHDVNEVATPEGWVRNPRLVLDFYNQRRKKALEVKPNRGHDILAELQSDFDVTVVTQNVDNLHEQAGSHHVIHLHGSLFESRSCDYPELIYPIKGWELRWGDVCERGSQLRPNIVWFGELVPMIEVAAKICTKADVFLVVGTIMMVYPAASLIDYVPHETPKYVIDPKVPQLGFIPYLTSIEEKGSVGLAKIKQALIDLSK
mgnify:CR=1 FL=1